jgi:heme a synthase
MQSQGFTLSSVEATTELEPVPRWLHHCAVLTVCCTAALLAIGAVVTTFQVGMTDPVWPTYPWHLALIDWREPKTGYIIEHTHRLAGWTVGACSIVLCAGLWRFRARRALGWLGIAALLGVIAQGVMGGLRVVFNELHGTDLKMIHGSFASLVFSLLVCIAVLTSVGWPVRVPHADATELTWLRRWSLLTAALIYGQLLLGSLVRHNVHVALGQRGHLFLAFAVVVGVAFLVREVFRNPAATRGMVTAATLLVAFLMLQLMLGIESWIMKFGQGGLVDLRPVTIDQAIVRTGHFLMGSGIFATSVALTLLAFRQSVQARVAVASKVGPLEGTA